MTVEALTNFDYRVVSHRGSHVNRRLDRDDLDEPRIVTVPLASPDGISTEPFRSIAQQCDGDDFYAWCRWIDEHAQALLIPPSPGSRCR